MRRIILLSIIMVCAIGSMAQTTIKMKTAKEIGEDFALTVNEGLICLIDWGDGKTDTVYSTTEPISGTVAGNNITLSAIGITYFDCSGQDLSQITFTSASSIETLILSNNKLITCNVSGLPALKTLWVDNNMLTTLDLSKSFVLESLLASNNSISTVKTSYSGLTQITDCWLNNNRLSQLSLKGSTQISTLNIENNALDSLTLSQLDGKALAVFIDGNSLDFTSLWNKGNSLRWYGTQQEGLKFAQDSYKTGEAFTLARNLFKKNQDEMDLPATSYTFAWYKYENGVKGSKLTKGAPGNTTADYTVPAASNKKNIFTFNKPFEDIQLEIKNNKYFGFLLLSDHISIIDPTGIEDASAANNLSCTTGNGSVTLQADKPTTVSIFSTSGMLHWKGEVHEPVCIQLNKGIYIINNTKIAIK